MLLLAGLLALGLSALLRDIRKEFPPGSSPGASDDVAPPALGPSPAEEPGPPT